MVTSNGAQSTHVPAAFNDDIRYYHTKSRGQADRQTNRRRMDIADVAPSEIIHQ